MEHLPCLGDRWWQVGKDSWQHNWKDVDGFEKCLGSKVQRTKWLTGWPEGREAHCSWCPDHVRGVASSLRETGNTGLQVQVAIIWTCCMVMALEPLTTRFNALGALLLDHCKLPLKSVPITVIISGVDTTMGRGWAQSLEEETKGSVYKIGETGNPI